MTKEQIMDATIIGAGPAGLLASQGLLNKNILLIEKGSPIPKRTCPMNVSCLGCNSCGQIEGVGGAGGWSDGKLCLGPVGILDHLLGEHYPEEVQNINEIFRKTLGHNYREPDEQVTFRNLGGTLTQEVTEVANLGSSTVRLLFQQIYEEVLNSEKIIITNDPVVKVNKRGEDLFLVKTRRGREFYSRNLIVATGKGDFTIIPQLIESYKLKTISTEPTLGLRLIIPNEEMEKIKVLGNNPKIKLHLPNGDTVKTHCLVFGGETIAYACGDYLLVGGRADYQNPTAFSNINILYKFSSGNPKDERQVVRSTLARIKNDYPQNVICQDLGSFFNSRKKPQDLDIPACRGAKLGNLLQYYPPKVIESIREFIQEIANTYGINLMNKAIVLGPAAEWLNDAVTTSLEMETAMRGLYVIGDGAGLTQGIVAAAVTGYRAAHSIKDRL